MLPAASDSPPYIITQTDDLQIIHELAHEIWYPTYQAILSKEQIAYMLKQIYDPIALQKQSTEGQVFMLACTQNEPVGFASYSFTIPEEKVYKLNKIYIKENCQGQGVGQLLLKEIENRCRHLGGKILELNVHRQNPARHFYAHAGFAVHQTVDIPFGPFFLNDYIMRKPL